ncbi:MAG: hypothetical protein ABH879_08170 [archaeon]
MKKAIAASIAVVLVLNLVLFAMSLTDWRLFWLIIAAAAIYAYTRT